MFQLWYLKANLNLPAVASPLDFITCVRKSLQGVSSQFSWQPDESDFSIKDICWLVWQGSYGRWVGTSWLMMGNLWDFIVAELSCSSGWPVSEQWVNWILPPGQRGGKIGFEGGLTLFWRAWSASKRKRGEGSNWWWCWWCWCYITAGPDQRLTSTLNNNNKL